MEEAGKESLGDITRIAELVRLGVRWDETGFGHLGESEGLIELPPGTTS